jgi:hypothetical protein
LKALHFQKIPHFSAQAVAPPPAATATLAPAPEVDVPAPMPARPRGLKPAFSAGLGTLAFLLVGVWSIRNTFVDEPTSQPLPPVVAEPTPPFVPAPPIHVIKPKPETVDPPPHAGSTEASPSYPLSSSEVLPNTIELTSDPSGAEVHLNGVTLGVTPLRMPRAQARGKVVVKLEGYVPTARQLGPDQRTNVRIRLVPRHIAVEF